MEGLIKQIEQALEEVNALISEFSEAKSRKMNVSLNQLKKIALELTEVKKIMNPTLFRPTFGRMIVDSWDYREEKNLRRLLLDIESCYLKINKTVAC